MNKVIDLSKIVLINRWIFKIMKHEEILDPHLPQLCTKSAWSMFTWFKVKVMLVTLGY